VKIVAPIAFGLFSLSAAIADECDLRVADLVRQSDATIVRRSDNKVFLKLRDFSELNVICKPPGIDIGIDLGAPPDVFFEFVGRAAGIASGLAAQTAKSGAIKCHREALRKRPNETTIFDYHGAHFECRVSIMPAPGRTSIIILRPKRR